MIECVPWTTEHEQSMRDPAGASCLPFLRAEVLSGRSKLWRCTDGASLAYMVTRFDRNPDELVIAYCEGRDMHKFAGAFLEAARAQRVPLRIHTTKPSIARYLRRYGLQLQEYVLRTELPA